MNSSTRLDSYVFLNGTCKEAFTLYQSLLGGELNVMMTGDSPMKDEMPPEMHDRVMHARLTLPGGAALMGSDCPPEMFEKQQGFRVSIGIATAADAERIFAALSEGGEIFMQIEETFWAERFGSCTDRFGVPWMVNCEKSM